MIKARSQLLLKLGQRLNETSKTLRRRIAAKFGMYFIGSLIELNQILKFFCMDVSFRIF